MPALSASTSLVQPDDLRAAMFMPQFEYQRGPQVSRETVLYIYRGVST